MKGSDAAPVAALTKQSFGDKGVTKLELGHEGKILNLQPKGSQAKPYQVKQMRELILKYQLEID